MNRWLMRLWLGNGVQSPRLGSSILMDLWNHRIVGWKRPLRPSSPTITAAPPSLLNHVPKCHTHTVFEPLWGRGLPHCPGQPGPTPDHSLGKEIFPNIRSEPPLMQLEAIASRPIAGWLGENTDTNPAGGESVRRWKRGASLDFQNFQGGLHRTLAEEPCPPPCVCIF